MKTKIFTLFITLFTIISFAQSQTSGHLTFKGTPIDGTLDQYISKMKQNGFTHLNTDDGTALLSGDFAGYKACFVGIGTSKQKDLVYKIVVIFPNQETWYTLSGNYFDLKEMLTEKYGKPSDVVEKFDTNSQPTNDHSRMHEVKFDRSKYYSIFQTEKGNIELSIEHGNSGLCYAQLIYFDKINYDIIKKEAKGDL